MGIITNVVRTIAVRVHRQIEFMAAHPHKFQQSIFQKNVKRGRSTIYGKERDFGGIQTYEDYKKQVPLNTFEDLRPYMNRVLEGEKNVLWPGKPKYVVGTSGTTGGIKYIPLSKDSLPYHYNSARNAVFNYTLKYGLLKIFNGKLLFLSGSPQLSKTGTITSGRLSGIVNHQIPRWLKFNQIPSWETNIIEDWEEKIYRIAEESIKENMTMISGIPPWVMMYYESLLEQSGADTIKDLFPNYDLFVYGGVNFEPYRKKFEEMVGRQVDSIETYPSSEGFVAFQDIKGEAGMLLNVNGGIFFEFVPAHKIHDENPERIQLKDVELGKDYAIIMNNNAGLWASILGDVVEFTSLNPYRLIVKGRVEHFISAFGEHIIANEVESAMSTALSGTGVQISEFTVAPQVNPPEGGLPYHEWIIETENKAIELSSFGRILDQCMQSNNFHYKDLISGKVITRLKLTPVPRGTFNAHMKAKGKLGGQNKIPHLSNDRNIAESLIQLAKESRIEA
ncbi:MAG: GH3 auxin-responsive promoter family protein [Bacteroidota bacterium]